MKTFAYQNRRVVGVAQAALLSGGCLPIAGGGGTRSPAQARPPAARRRARPARRGRRAGCARLGRGRGGEEEHTPPGRPRPGRGGGPKGPAGGPAEQRAPQPTPPTRGANPANTFDARTGTVGVY